MIQTNRKYTFDELGTLRNDPAVAQAALKGYVLRYDLDGTVQFVRWNEAAGGGGDFRGRPGTVRPLHEDKEVVHYTEDKDAFGELPPIVKRTPQQRLDSMMLRVLADFKAGRVMTEEQIKAHVDDVTAQAWKDGRTEITGEVVREVIQRFLQRAEETNEEQQRKQVARTAPSD